MSSTRRDVMRWGVTAALGLACPHLWAQGYPDKAIELVVPYPPGASTDLIGRILQERLAAELGQPVVIENKGGAGGNMGATYVAKSQPDGYKLLLSTNAITTLNPHVMKGGFDPLKELVAVAQIANGPIGIAVRGDSSISTLAELVAFAKQHPNKLSFGSAGNGSPQHVIGELLNQAAGVSMLHVPYRGIGPALTDLLGGNINVVISTLAGLSVLASSNKVKVLAIAEDRRFKGAPNIPTIAETYPGFVASSWFGVYAPAGTRPEVVKRLNAAVNNAVANEQVNQKLVAAGLVPISTTPEGFAKLTRDDYERWGKLVKQKNIHAD
jgi:tripartite-type tricarboxylate transporter receptor subunit TctC